MKHFCKRLAMPAILGMLYVSCNDSTTNTDGTISSDSTVKQTKMKSDTLKLDSLSLQEAQALSDSISPTVDTSTAKGLLSGKGKVWKLWEKLHKNCQNNEMTKGMTYLGVSNTLGIGSVVSYDENRKAYVASYPMLRENLSEEEKKMSFQDGTNSSCQFSQKTKLSTDFLFKTNMVKTGNATLSAAIEHAKSIESKIDSWKQNVLFVDAFRTVINSKNTQYSKGYVDACKLPGRYVIAIEIEINGFSAVITTSTEIDANLKAELDKGITEKLADTNASIKFSYEGTNTIKVSTTGAFVVFGALYKE